MDDAAFFDLPPEFMAELASAGAESDKGFEVWRINWPIVDAFVAISTQWRTVSHLDGRTLWIGLDYTAVRAGLKGAGIKLSKTQWRGLTMMEREASDVLNGK